jgi:hypothetical protein
MQIAFTFQGTEVVVGRPGLDAEMGRHLPHRGRITLLLKELFYKCENGLLSGS